VNYGTAESADGAGGAGEHDFGRSCASSSLACCCAVDASQPISGAASVFAGASLVTGSAQQAKRATESAEGPSNNVGGGFDAAARAATLSGGAGTWGPADNITTASHHAAAAARAASPTRGA